MNYPVTHCRADFIQAINGKTYQQAIEIGKASRTDCPHTDCTPNATCREVCREVVRNARQLGRLK